MKAFIIVLSLLLLTGCAEGSKTVTPEIPPRSEHTSDMPEKETVEIIPESKEELCEEPVTVSPLSQEDFLPIDSYSDAREEEIEYVMIHFTSAVMLSRSNPYDMKLIRGIFEDNEVSIHYIIDRDGKILCYIPEDRTAWHAGRGSFNGIENRMNHHSVGIELVGMGSEADMAIYMSGAEYRALDKSLMGFTEAQYESLSLLVADICNRNKIPTDREHIIGHSEYNPTKSDPGELFDFEKFLENVKGIQNEENSYSN